MPLDIQSSLLRQTPYFDDYDENKNFHRVLFKPSVAVQARELTQLQTILQNQIERFGDNIYKTGTIIKGCSLTTDDQYYYIKLFDLQPNGDTYSLAELVNTYVIDATSNLTALTVNYKTGSQASDPNLSTLYLKYLNTGTGGQKAFSNNSTLTSYNRDYRVESVVVVGGGSLYANGDSVVFTSGVGSGAVARLSTYANGTIKNVDMLEKGFNYTTAPTVSVTSNTGSGANVVALNYIAQLTVANSVFAAPVGTAFAIRTSEGIVYQKGHFVRVAAHEEVVSKYTTTPDSVVVGFGIAESVVNASADTTLLDNANNSTNYTAPGADRLQLTANLVVLTTTEAATNNTFLALYEFQGGRIIKDKTSTQFNSINKEFAKRTFEESGDYVVDPIPVYTEAITSNTTHLNVVVGAGLAYVEGNRVQIYNNTKIPVPKGTSTRTDEQQTISTSYGGFVIVNELLGNFNIKAGESVTLRNAAGTDVSDNAGGTPTAPGTQIGTARVRSIAYDSGTPGTPTCQYRLYIFDVQMTSGFSFKDVRSVGVASAGVADVVLDPVFNYAVLNDAQFDSLIFSTGTFAVQTLTDETFISRSQTNAAFAIGGTLTASFAGGNTLPYSSGALNSVQERDFIVVPQTTLVSGTNKTGTTAISSGANSITGTSTLFTSEYQIGQYIKVGTQSPLRITSIASNTSMTVANTFGATATAQTHTFAYPTNVPIDFQTSTGKTISVSGDKTTLTLDLGHTLTGTGTVSIYHDVQNDSPAVKVKAVNGPLFTKISTAQLVTSRVGPWSLGVPDAYKIEGVYVGTANTYSNTSTNYVNEFILDNGQNDNYYGLANIKKRPGSTLALANTNCLLVSYKAFTHGTGKYISTESYSAAIDDATAPLPANKIRTQDIPVYISPKTGRSYDLRDVLDFRPIAANTANLATTVAGATIDPSTTTTFSSTEKFFPSPTREFTCSINSYEKRKDRIVIDSFGDIKLLQGIASNSPSAPSQPRGTMSIGIVHVTPYPSLSAKDAADYKRTDLGVFVTPIQTKRYTMKDIGDIDKRINRLEYYALLNTLEQNTKQLVIPSEANNAIERFKNGFFVDPLSDYNISDLNDSEYRIVIDTVKGVARPNFADVKIDVEFDAANSSGVEKTGDLVTLSYTPQEFLKQPIGNKVRSLVDQYWRYASTIKLVPAFDNYYDIQKNAVSIAIDIATPLNNLAKATSDALSQLKVSTSLDSTTNVGDAFQIGSTASTTVWQQNIEKTFTDTLTKVNPAKEKITVVNIGDYVTDFTLNPYVRPQRINFYAAGLRPGARHYVYFDTTDLSAQTTPGKITTFTDISANSFTSTLAKGANLVANSSGEVAGFVDIPANTFFTGERSLIIMDISLYGSEDSASSKAIGTFSAYAFNVAKTNLSISTKTAGVSLDTAFTASNFTNTFIVSDKLTFERPIPRRDPLSQTFRVQRQSSNTDGLYLTSIDVYFSEKDPIHGVNLELRETNNGVPSGIVLPFSTVHLPSSNVSTSNTGATSTRFTFDSPVYVKTETDYAIVMYPDANAPDYRVWTAIAGTVDAANTSLVSNQNWGLGTLFYSTSGSSWTAVQDEDLKFTVNRAKFDGLSGTAVVHNGDYEFLTIGNTSGTFIGGEDIAQLSTSYLTGTFTTNTVNTTITTSNNQTSIVSSGDYIMLVYANNIVTRTGNVNVTSTTVTNGGGQTTSFTNEYSNGDFIRIGNEIRQVIQVTNATSMKIDTALASVGSNAIHYSMAPLFDVARVITANSTTLTLNKPPLMSSNATVIVNGQKVVAGVVDTYDYGNNKVYISRSNAANDDFKIMASNSTYRGTLIGGTSQGLATVTSVDSINTNIFRPLFNTLVIPGTGISLTGTFTTNSSATDTRTYKLTSSNRLDFNEDAVVKSRSAEITGVTLNKSFTAELDLSSSSLDTSPLLDVNPSSVVLTRNLINNDDTNETTRYGNAVAKYISKRIVLADGLDAEDVKVFLTAFKPTGTSVDVYAKILNFTDGAKFEDNDWTLLKQVTSASLFSDSLNEDDYREFEFTFPKTPPSTVLAGVATAYSNTTITGVDTTFTSTLVANDLIKIVKSNTETDYDILPVISVGNNTTLTVSSNVSFTGTGNKIEKVTQQKAAFKYTRNNYIVRYHDKNDAAYDTYKYMAIKIVLKSPYNYLVPILNDLRVLAVSV